MGTNFQPGNLADLDNKLAKSITGGLSKTKKMPCASYGLPARACITGGKLQKIDGSVCSICYALRAHYQYPNVQAAQFRRLESINDPEWVNAMVFLIEETGKDYFRWHDSGDIQSLDHLNRIVLICRKTPLVRHWLPTKEKELVLAYNLLSGEFPRNLTVRVSAPMVDGKPSSMEFTSTVTTKDMPITEYSYLCPAKNNGNRCGDCRSCWDRNIPDVTYHAS